MDTLVLFLFFFYFPKNENKNTKAAIGKRCHTQSGRIWYSRKLKLSRLRVSQTGSLYI